MNKAICALLGILIVGTVVLSGCVDEEPDTLYENSVYGFTIDYPTGWDIEEGTGLAIVEFIAPTSVWVAGDNIHNRIGIAAEDATGYTLDEYAIAAMQTVYIFYYPFNFELMDAGDMTINGVDARYVVYTFTFDDYYTKFKQVFIKQEDGTAFVISYSALESVYGKNIVEFDKSVSTFKFI